MVLRTNAAAAGAAWIASASLIWSAGCAGSPTSTIGTAGASGAGMDGMQGIFCCESSRSREERGALVSGRSYLQSFQPFDTRRRCSGVR